ncbi:DUF7501 family protein [Haloprofundus halobius]|uniref:DUF7501 family protein n=1 Tax=Haloprofundus halobius TaxID=2876194 RepID=UPI001CCC01C6|nr:hypothetical protein [Haloprofundus halobius]
MHAPHISHLTHAWEDPSRCPFCLSALDGGVETFPTHLSRSPYCSVEFDDWEQQVGELVVDGWVA